VILLLFVLTQGVLKVHQAAKLAQGGDPQRSWNKDGWPSSSSNVLS